MQDTQFKNQLIDIIDEKIAASSGGLVIIEPTQEDDGLYLGYSFADIQAALGAGSVLAEMKVTGSISFNLCYLKVFGASSGTFFAEFTNGHTFSASSQTDPLIYQNT